MSNMKIIQTFWSKPIHENSGFIHNRHKGGWLSEKYFAIACALSFMKLKKIHGNVELYTDVKGKMWLVDELGLEYDKVHVKLDQFNFLPSALWAIPKLYVFSLQDKPFLHVDLDVFIWGKFSDHILNAPLIAQNFDKHQDYNIDAILFLEKNNSIDILKKYLNYSDYNSINAGIIGGTDIEFIKEYSTSALNFIKEIENEWNSNEAAKLNFIAEQFFFYQLSLFKKKNINFLFESVGDENEDLMKFYLVPKSIKYIHLISNAKRNPYACHMIECHLYNENKLLLERISKKYKNNDKKVIETIIKDEYLGINICKVIDFTNSLLHNEINNELIKSLSNIINDLESLSILSTDLLLSKLEFQSSYKKNILDLDTYSFLKKCFKLNSMFKVIISPIPINNTMNSKNEFTDAEYVYLVFKKSEQLFMIKEIEDEELILYYLQDVISGHELISKISDNNESDYENLVYKVYDFLLCKICYTSIIEVV